MPRRLDRPRDDLKVELMKKLVLIIVALIVVAAGVSGWNAYQNKRTFDAVMAEHQKASPSQR